MEIPKLQGQYETGQLFLHRVFGYRGVILFPWLARVYDRDLPNQSIKVDKIVKSKVEENEISSTNNAEEETVSTTNSNSNNSEKEHKGKTNTFYQVLIDSRDCPYIVSR